VLKGLAQPEQIFQLLEPGLGSKFPPLRVEEARQGRMGGLASLVRRRREPTFEDLAWQVRGRMVGVDEPTRAALAALGAELFAAGRSDAEGMRLLARTDRRLLERRLREHEELGTLSRRAREQAAVVQAQLDLLGEIADCRRALALRAARAREAMNASTATAAGATLAAATARLDRALTRARAEIGSTALRLRRTRYPGVHRAGDLYAVPSIDEAGIESVPTFATFREAKAYRRAQRLREKTFSSKLEAETAARANLRISTKHMSGADESWPIVGGGDGGGDDGGD
jgi:hypothetical protein